MLARLYNDNYYYHYQLLNAINVFQDRATAEALPHHTDSLSLCGSCSIHQCRACPHHQTPHCEGLSHAHEYTHVSL